MEGRGTSRRRNPFKIWKRRISAVLALVMTAGLVLNAPLSLADFGFRISDVYASGSNAERRDSTWATASNAKYKQGESQEVDIYVIAEDNEAVPDNSTFLTLYLRNNTGQMITEGSLTFKGNHIAQKDGYFQDMGTTKGDSPVIVVDGGETGAAQDVQKPAAESSGEGMIYQEPETEISNSDPEPLPEEEAQPDAENLPDDVGTEESEETQDDEDENDAYELIGIDLQPGEMREIQFEFYTDEDEDSTKAYVEFTFRGDKEDGSRVKSDSKFYYSIGLPFVDLSLEEGMKIESGVSNDMEIWMNEPTWVDENLEERIEAREEKEAEEEYEALEEAEDVTIASGSDAEKEDTASPSDADREETSQEQKDQEKIDQYVQEAMEISESKVSYEIEIYGAQFERFSPRKAEEAEGLGWISCVYEVANHTAPGLYYGKVRANGRWNNEKFTSEQGFFFEVTGTAYPAQTFTADTEDIQVTVTAEEGILPKDAKLNVTKLTPDNEETAQQYKEAEEAMAAEGTQYDGMLALDITFQDEDGNEIEPNGNVQVSIEMKETEIAEGVSPESIEVHHLKENQQGDETEIQVEKVADGADETAGTVEMKEAGNEAAVVAVEFEVESFSTFVVTYGRRELKLENIQFVDENGSEIYPPSNVRNQSLEIPLPDEPELHWSDILQDTVFNSFTIEEDTYRYKEIKIGDQVVTTIAYYTEKWLCKKVNTQNEYVDINKKTEITLVYTKEEAPDNTGNIETVDSSAAGITLNLFDYNGRINGGSSATDVSNKRALTFKNDGEGVDGTNKKNDGWLDADRRNNQKGIVKTNLGDDGYPKTNPPSSSSKSLDYLFGGDNTWNDAITAYSANYLFTYDETSGYYEYNSAEHAADYSVSDERFYVKEYPEAPEDRDSGSFLPFNTRDSEDSNGEWVTRDDGKAQFEYPEKNVDYWFGMTMETNFLQPADGKVNGEDMVFEFTGDDDVWVFIDDMLVLDLGGVHAAETGTINFANGSVSFKDETSTIRDLFEQAMQDAGMSEDDINEQLSDIFVDGSNVFKDYSTHTMKYYYLERGGDVSNCFIRFNLQVIPEALIAVGKKVIGSEGQDVNSDQTSYTFQLLKADGETPVEEQSFKIYGGIEIDPPDFSVIAGLQPLTSGSTDKEGKFTLKQGQIAVFEEALSNETPTYVIKEILAEDTKVNAVFVNREDKTTNAEETLDITNQYALFENQVETKNIAIEKIWSDKGNSDKRPESIEVILQWKQNGAFVDYPNADFPLSIQISPGAEGWIGSFENLPKYDSNGNEIEYGIREIAVNGYTASYAEDAGKGSFTITNVFQAAELKLKKIGKNGGEIINGLAGATFELSLNGSDKQWQALTTGEDGTATFTGLEEGTYTLTETKAPDGYSIGGPWTFTVSADGNITFTDSSVVLNKGYYEIVNQAGVELPETGGPGLGQIREFGWMLLCLAAMMAGVEVQMNRRRRNCR